MSLRKIWEEQANERAAKFYIIKCWNEEETFFKVGVTYKSIKRRFAGKKIMPYNFKLVRLIESNDIKKIKDLEERFLNKTKHKQYTPQITFKGKTECRQNLHLI